MEMDREMKQNWWDIMNEQRLEGSLCDAVFKVDGVTFNIHKNVMCTASHYFRILFTRTVESEEQREFATKEVTPDIMRSLIESAYMRPVHITENNVERLFSAATRFAFPRVVHHCCNFLKSRLSPENCIGMHKFAKSYFSECLERTTYEFILSHFKDVVEKSEELVELVVDDLDQIISEDTLNVNKEEFVFHSIVKWIGHQPDSRKMYMTRLLPKVRFGVQPSNRLIDVARCNEYVKRSKKCHRLLNFASKLQKDSNLRSKHHSALTRPRLPSSVLFAIGGWNAGSPTNAIETYNPRTDTWVNVTPEEEAPRAYFETAYLDGFIYLVGGFDSLNYFSDGRRFDPVNRVWKQIAPMYVTRCYISIAVHDNLIYALGGFDGHERVNSAERYNPRTNQWTMVAPMNEKRSDAGASVLGGKIYVCGGFDGIECLASAEYFVPESNEWTEISRMNSCRSGIGVITYNNLIYAVGGFDGEERLCSVEAYNPSDNTWTLVASMFNPRSNFGLELLDDMLFVAGGYDGLTTIDSVEFYDHLTNEWKHAQDMGICRSALSCCVVSKLPNVHLYISH